MDDAKPARQLLPAVLVFDVPGHDGTAVSRLKRFMKAALRAYGLRCVELRLATPEEAARNPAGPSGDLSELDPTGNCRECQDTHFRTRK